MQRLHLFYRAFEAYRRDHGAFPSTPADLYPRYIHSLGDFVCPAYRSSRFSVPMAQRVRVGRQQALNTYYFPYGALRDPAMHLRRERVPLMLCRIHAELLHEDSYRKPVEDKRQFIAQYGVPELLILWHNGRVSTFDDLDLPRTGIHYLDFGRDEPPSELEPSHRTSAVRAGVAPAPRAPEPRLPRE